MSAAASSRIFSWARMQAMVYKEFVQMRRDRLTFAMVLGIPVIQLIIFGYAINFNPKHLPTAVVSGDHGTFTRDIVAGLQNTGYFHIAHPDASETEAERLLRAGNVLFVVNFPVNFSRDLIRGESPSVLIDADATDSMAVGSAMGVAQTVVNTAWQRDLPGPIAQLRPPAPAINLVTHARYNPEAITQYSIVPGLMGVILTMTMVLITALAITRESERGTMEALLTTPVRPIEVMIGKIIPYILVGYIQMTLILVASQILFQVPMAGSVILLFATSLLFILASLSVGITFSTIAKNQLQAMQMGFFFFLPSILLSGFMFPFQGMPLWARCLGSVLPLTHYLRLVRGIMLKGNGIGIVWHHLWPIALFLLVVMAIGVKRYRRTLD